jgi:hypothetical protein
MNGMNNIQNYIKIYNLILKFLSRGRITKLNANITYVFASAMYTQYT